MYEDDDQPTLLQGAMIRARELHPTAAVIEVQTTDQDNYGFDLVDIKDVNGHSLLSTDARQDEASDEMHPFLRNLRWNGVVGENNGGYADITIDLLDNPTFDLDFTVAQRYQGSMTASEIRKRFGIQPGELLALIGSHAESLQGPLADLQYGKHAKGHRIHTLTGATLRAPKRTYRVRTPPSDAR